MDAGRPRVQVFTFLVHTCHTRSLAEACVIKRQRDTERETKRERDRERERERDREMKSALLKLYLSISVL